MGSSTPVVLRSANDAADEVRRQALISASESCYGVGGIIVENGTGKIIKAWGNRAQGRLKSGEYYPLDPSNHGEMQLVRWYYENQDQIKQELGYLPKPQQLTVVTSLDPCAMCAGGLCAAGFNVGVIAPDDSGGGVNWDSTARFDHVPDPIRDQLRSLFGYYSVYDVSYRSTYKGNPNLLFNSSNLSDLLYHANTAAFDDSAAAVKKVRDLARISLKDIHDPASLPAYDSTIVLLKNQFPEALKLRLSQKVDINQPGLPGSDIPYYRPSEELHLLLKQAVASEPGATNAVAMIDQFGNLLRIGVDTPSQGPIKTALFNAISDYSRFLFGLISEASDATTPEKYKQSTAYNYLSPANRVSYIYLRSPSGGLATTLKDLGLYGSANDGIIQYIEPPTLGTKSDFEQHVRALPIYYLQSEEITPLQTVPDYLNIIVENGNDDGPGSLRSAIERANLSGTYHSIRINTTQPIILKSELPAITSPIDLYYVNPNSKSTIDFAGTSGFKFAPTANGSSLKGLLIKGASDFGIDSQTSSLQLSELFFGDNGIGSNNKLGSIRNPGQFKGLNLEGWEAALGKISTDYNISSRFMDIKGANALVSTVRVDSEKELVRFGFKNTQIPLGVPSIFTYDPASQGALTSDIIEKYLTNGKSTFQLAGEPFGLQKVQNLERGHWLPVATLNDTAQTPLSLSSLQQTGNTIEAEFKLLMKTAKESTDTKLTDLLDKTYKFTWTLPSPSANTRSQQGELGLTYSKQATNNLKFGFYEVSDPLTGLVGGLLPTQVGYQEAAIAKSINDGLFVYDTSSMDGITGVGGRAARRNASDSTSATSLTLSAMDPHKSYGVVVTGFSGQPSLNRAFYTTYDSPNDNSIYPFKGFLLSDNRLALGIESDLAASRGDFSDLVLTLPDNFSLFKG